MYGLDRKEQDRASSRQRRMNRKQSCSIADKLTPGLVDDDAQLSSESEQSITDWHLTDDEYSAARATPRRSSVELQIPENNSRNKLDKLPIAVILASGTI